MDESERLSYKLFISENDNGYDANASPGDPREDKKHRWHIDKDGNRIPFDHMPAHHYIGDEHTSVCFEHLGREYVFTRIDFFEDSCYTVDSAQKEIRRESETIGEPRAKEICLEEILKVNFHNIPYKLRFIFRLNAKDWELI